MKRFDELCDLISDQCDPVSCGISAYVGLEHIDGGAFRLSRYGDSTQVRSSKSRFKRGDILYGKLRPYLDKAIIACCDGICSTDILVLRPKDDICGVYLLGLIHTAEFLSRAISTTQGVNHPRTSWSALSEFEWNIPIKPLQQKVAAVLWELQNAIEAEQKLIAAAQDLKQSAMRHIFARGLDNELQKESTIGKLPQTWELRNLSSIAKIERGRFMHRPRNEPRFYGGSTPFVQTGDVVRSRGRIQEYTQTLNDEGVAISRVFPKGTILITIAANIGFTGILGFDSACPDSLVAITPCEAVDVHYLEYYLQTQQPEMDRLAPKGTQKNINIQFLNPWPVAVAPLHEQRKIVDILQRIDRQISIHEGKRSALQDLFKTLLHQLMAGQIRLNDLEIDTRQVAT
jgi:type I restriction enzyme S subunit